MCELGILRKSKEIFIDYLKKRKNVGFSEVSSSEMEDIKKRSWWLYKTESIFQHLFLASKGHRAVCTPEYVLGHEAIYEQFLGGVLIYRPTLGSDVGKVELPIASLLDPLKSTFDLSQCGDAGQYLSISTGYRKRKIAANANKYEIWLTPKFAVENDLDRIADHYRDIMDKWTAPYGIFYAWGGWEDLTWYDYLIELSPEEISSKNLYENWHQTNRQLVDIRYARPNTSKHFSFNFN